MSKKTWSIIFIDIVLLCLLFLASSTDLILKERRQESYKITVMIDMEGEGESENFKAGANKAAIDKILDMNIINIAGVTDGEEAKQLLQKEMTNGSRGLVLHCDSKERAEKLIGAVPVGVPVVLYGCEVASPRVRGKISSDLTLDGQILAAEIIKGRKKGEDITIVEQTAQKAGVTAIHDAIAVALRQEGVVVRRVGLEDISTAGTLVNGLALQGGNILVCADLPILQALAETNGRSTEALPLFGAGWSLNMREPLEEGVLKGTLVSRSYEGGYLAVEKIANILQNKGVGEEVILIESAFVTKDNLYDVAVESIVFPYN